MTQIKLYPATPKQIKYACMFLHYAKTVPSVQIGYSCYEGDKFVGCICFGGGANNNLGKKYGLLQGQLMELVRVALIDQNQREYQTSKYVSLAMKLLKRDKPLVKLLVSYADTKQNHHGGIYQATNWLYMGESYAESAIDPETGEIKHTRSLHSKYGTIKGFQRVKDKPKHIYLYPFEKVMRAKLSSAMLGYPSREAGAIPSRPHQEVSS